MDVTSDIVDVDLQLALKLKAKYPEHFQNLVRMHLSFALDLNIEECDEQSEKIKPNANKWSFCKKPKPSKDQIDGNPLTEAGIARMYSLILYLCREENLVQEGIFRKTGALTRQLQLKNCLNEGISVNFDDNNFSVHDCASVLKNFLSELPEPLVTDVHYPLYCQISEWCKCSEFEARLLRSLQLLVLLLPSNNALLLKYVINLLFLTAKHVEFNKMSAENLATLFTPHILCPRKLSGEMFHTNAQMLYQIVVFMIENGPEMFKIPAGLAADIRLYWHEKEKKKLSPKNCLNESVADSCVVNTVFSFVDREKTAQENVTNPTETALAQLYAHIQSLPESSKKRKLVKQFNRENGYGTPKRVLLNNNDKPHSLTRNISDSLKKHIFSKNSGKQEKLLKLTSKEKFDQNATPESRFKGHSLKLFEKRLPDCMDCGCADVSDRVCSPPIPSTDEPDAGVEEKLVSSMYNSDRANSCSEPEDPDLDTESVHERGIDAESQLPDSACTTTFQTPRIRKEPAVVRANSVHCKLGTPTTCTTKPVSSHFYGTLTSTPAPVCFSNDVLTPSPFCCSNEDMSPITMSAHKMPKSMQEVMMTPRSRRPVLAVSGSNTNLLAKEKSRQSGVPDEEHDANRTSKSHNDERFETCLGSSKDQTNLSNLSGDSLTDTFREYLYSRSMLTTSIADDSFSSRTGDFDPSSVSEDKMSDSLLYCLDGGTPTQNTNDAENSHGYEEVGRVHETLL